MNYQKEMIALFCEHIKKLSNIYLTDKKGNRKNEKADDPSESYIYLLIQLLDLLALLDALKNMKASLNNDFSFYKRYASKGERENKEGLGKVKKITTHFCLFVLLQSFWFPSS
jgi:cytoplasmic FMR1 interacting protein